jgi:rod shape-determining protein MreD
VRPPVEAPALEQVVAVHRARALPWVTVMAASLLSALPVVAAAPLMPPTGLLMLLAWRLLAPLALRVWAPALLGLFDDLVSGQPLGSAMLLWQLGAFLVALAERRSLFRSFWQDWLIAAGVIAFCLIGGRLLAVPLSARVDPVLGAQIVISVLAFPLAARVVAFIDRKRGAA